MKGWVYVITNIAMPDLVKVGFSTKDPELRASELNHTGSPHPYAVEYEILIDDPHAIEQRAHKLLKHRHDGKEWFRCSIEEAISAIKQAAGAKLILENYKSADRERVQALERARVAESVQRNMESIRAEHQVKLDAILSKPRLWVYWVSAFFLCAMVYSAAKIKPSDWDGLICVVIATLTAPRARRYHQDRKKKSEPYKTVEAQMNGLLSDATQSQIKQP